MHLSGTHTCTRMFDVYAGLVLPLDAGIAGSTVNIYVISHAVWKEHVSTAIYRISNHIVRFFVMKTINALKLPKDYK